MRIRILDTALRLLTEGGRDAVSARAVTSALAIQAPTMYRIFGDMQGLLDAVAVHGFTTHMATWTGWESGADPVDVIRRGWDAHIDWGVANPHVYAIAYGEARPGVISPASAAIDDILRTLVEQAAAAGLLRLPVDQAVSTLRAIGAGVVLTLIATPEMHRDHGLSERGRDAALRTILIDPRSSPRVRDSGAAMQLKTQLPDTTALTAHEKALLGDWLDRIAANS